MTDTAERQLERAASTGDEDAQRRLDRMRCRRDGHRWGQWRCGLKSGTVWRGCVPCGEGEQIQRPETSPLVDPWPGDIVVPSRAPGGNTPSGMPAVLWRRRVVRRSKGGTYVSWSYDDDDAPKARTCLVTTWRRWAKGGREFLP